MKRRINKFTYMQEAVPLKTVIKEVLMHPYSRGLMPKDATQRVYNLLKLKES